MKLAIWIRVQILEEHGTAGFRGPDNMLPVVSRAKDVREMNACTRVYWRTSSPIIFDRLPYTKESW